ncbi:MAG: bacteriohopanetetrol glucosamine biosynthesis glycosyltransferase HpnI [Paracraurococcus sp.]
MPEWFFPALGLLAALAALAGCVTALLAARAVGRLAAAAPATGPALPASILKPLHGTQPGLAGALASTLAQRHAAPFEVLFAIRDPADPAGAVAEAAMAAAPGVPALLVRDARLHGPNRKVSQLMNLEGLAEHPVLVVADADMAVPPHWLTAVTAPLADPRVGLVTCLYRGEAAEPGLWSRLAALWIDWQFLPNAAMGEAMGRAHGCYGATMALRAETLARIGGDAALRDLLADDHALGVAVRRLGLRVVVAPVLPGHVQAEPDLKALVRHELRWARTLRLLDLPGYAGMGVTFPLAWAALAAALLPGGWAVLLPAMAARLALAVQVDRALRRRLSPARLALLPLRDGLSFIIWGLGLARGTVMWQGRRFRMRRDGSMVDARQ